MYALGLLPWASRLATRMPRVASGALRVRGIGTLLRRAAGVTTSRPAPAFARKPFRRTATARALDQADRATVVLWPDTFTNAFDPQLGSDTAAALAAAGETVHVPTQWGCCGRTLYDPGMLDLARRALRNVLDILDPFTSRGIPVVVPEPSCLSSFRDELPNLLPDDPRAARLAGLARSLSEHLLATGALPERASAVDLGPVIVHPHCHGRASVGTGADRDVLARLGYRPQTLDAGCCGLAGSYGFSPATAGISESIARDHWLPRLDAAVQAAGGADAGVTVAMDGFSCITQLSQLDGRSHRTVASLIAEALS
jgi:Fe-S oxidoreductase